MPASLEYSFCLPLFADFARNEARKKRPESGSLRQQEKHWKSLKIRSPLEMEAMQKRKYEQMLSLKTQMFVHTSENGFYSVHSTYIEIFKV
jgi:hypothetical protein